LAKINSSQGGFSLIELMVVISIITLLASILITSIAVARRAARDTKRKADAHQMEIAMELYYTDNQVYPSPIVPSADPFIPRCSGIAFNFGLIGNSSGVPIIPNYISAFPTDPLNIPLQYQYACNNKQRDYGILIPFGDDPDLPTCKITSSPTANVFNAYPSCGF
jgi:prepilin-type N-terminal cleavage/methylation domain-containing protein